jgi:hypothetical protein
MTTKNDIAVNIATYGGGTGAVAIPVVDKYIKGPIYTHDWVFGLDGTECAWLVFLASAVLGGAIKWVQFTNERIERRIKLAKLKELNG